MERTDFEALALFVAVAQHGGMNAASRETGVPKATLSRRVRALEGQLGTLLLERGGGQARMTEGGQRLFDRAAPMLAELVAASQSVATRDGQVRGSLRVSVPALISRFGLGPMVAAFVRSYPDVRLEIDIDDRFVDPVAGGYDVVVRANPATDSDLVGKCFLRTDSVLAALPGVEIPQTQDAEIDAVILTAQRGQSDWTFLREGQLRRVIPRPMLQCSSMMFVYEAVLAGTGAALLPAWLIEGDVKAGRLRAWGRVPNRQIEAWVLHMPSHVTSPKVKAFVDALVDAFRGVGKA